MGSGGGVKNPDTSSCWACAAVQGSIHPALLLALLGLLGMPMAHGACGPPPRMTHSQPFGVEQLSSFPVGSRVTYTCLHGAIRIPGLLDTVQCLPGSRWSELRDPCGLSCTTPTTLHFAALSEMDEMINFYPVGFTVSYICRPGYKNISESQPTSTCLESLTWSEVPELCQRKSCGPPAAPPAGRTLSPTDFLFGTRVSVLCNEGYQLHGRNFIQCWLKGDDVEWSKLPTCELITCSSPPRISNGRHDGEGVEKFAYNSTVTYSCDPGFQLIGNESIRCTRADNAGGAWSGAVPHCKEKSPPVQLRAKPMERGPPPRSSQRHSLKAPKKTFTMEMKLSLYKKALQNTNSFSPSSSFSKKPEPTRDLRVLPSTAASLLFSPRPAALTTYGGLKLQHFVGHGCGQPGEPRHGRSAAITGFPSAAKGSFTCRNGVWVNAAAPTRPCCGNAALHRPKAEPQHIPAMGKPERRH